MRDVKRSALVRFNDALSATGRDGDAALYRLAGQALLAEEDLCSAGCPEEARARLSSILHQIAATGARGRVGQVIKLQLAIQLLGTEFAQPAGESLPGPVPDLLQSLLLDLTEG
jgi:hypothetical protein